MTYDQDPARWSTDPDEAPELLRGAFSAGRNEGPSRNQMRSLAVKLAAASAGGAVAVGTVKAASAGNTLATAATWSAAKVASVVVLAGSVVTGAMIWRSSSPDAAHERGRAPAQAPARSADQGAEAAPEPLINAQPSRGASGDPASAPAVTAPQAVVTAPQAVVAPAGGTARAPAGDAPAGSAEPTPQAPQISAAQRGAASSSPTVRSTSADKPAVRGGAQEPSTSARGAAAQQRKPAAERTSTSTAASGAAASTYAARSARITTSSSAELPPPSEVSLLRNAQVALQSRPREAFQLTQQHRRLYPSGEFAQERDALAIQALMRAGETDQARELAQAFIRAYPTSPHAHRFREAMGIR